MNRIRFQMRMAIIVLLCLACIAGLNASEITAVWEKTYRQAASDDQRYAVMLKISELKNKEFAPLIAEALLKLHSSKIEAGDPTVVRTKLSLAKLLIQELGNLHSLENADLVFDVYRNSKDALLRGEAALSLGKMRATTTVEKLARDLSDINLKPNPDNARPQEILAFGLVQSLELMHAPEGFQPVFFASIGWYSGLSQVKETARAALKTMLPDPSPQLKFILIKETLLDRKLRVLESLEESTAPADAKLEIARIGLDQGLTVATTDVVTKRVLSDIRMKSIKILVANQDKAPESVVLYQRDIDLAFNTDELLGIYTALARNGSTEAITLLVKKMTDYNLRQKSKLNTDEDRKVIRQIVQSLAFTKSPLAKQVLTDSQYVDHDGQVAREVKLALEQIP